MRLDCDDNHGDDQKQHFEIEVDDEKDADSLIDMKKENRSEDHEHPADDVYHGKKYFEFC